MTYQPSPFVRRAVRDMIESVRPEFVELALHDGHARIVLDTIVEGLTAAHAVLVVRHAHRAPSETALRDLVAEMLPGAEQFARDRLAREAAERQRIRIEPMISTGPATIPVVIDTLVVEGVPSADGRTVERGGIDGPDDALELPIVMHANDLALGAQPVGVLTSTERTDNVIRGYGRVSEQFAARLPIVCAPAVRHARYSIEPRAVGAGMTIEGGVLGSVLVGMPGDPPWPGAIMYRACERCLGTRRAPGVQACDYCLGSGHVDH